MLKIESLELDSERLKRGGVDGDDTSGDVDGDTEELEEDLAEEEPSDNFWESLEETHTITRLTPGVRDQNRVNVFIDGGFAFSLDLAQVVELDVKVGQKVDKERLESLKSASEFGKLYQRTLEWVLTRPHSIRETRDYFRRRKLKRNQLNRQRVREGKKELPQIRDEHAAMVTERLIKKGYLDDRKFALFYIENRYVRRGISQKRLKLELRKKGVSEEIIQEAMAEQPRDEREEMLKMIKKKRQKYDDHKLIEYLVRQGFDFQTAKTEVENYREEE